MIPDIQLRGDFPGAEGWMRGLLIATFSIAQLLTAPFMGRFSDVFGRQRVLLLTTLLAAGSHAVYAHAGTLGMFLSRALAGVAGANIGVAYAYVADATAPKDRAKSFGLIGTAFGLGFIFGPPLGAFLLSLGCMPGQPAGASDARPAVRQIPRRPRPHRSAAGRRRWGRGQCLGRRQRLTIPGL